MRKILLATTAIVAMGAGSAMAADVTISGSFELGFKNSSQNKGYAATTGADSSAGDASTAATAAKTYMPAEVKNGSSTYVQSDVNINFSSTTDSGLTMKMGYGLDENGSSDTANTDDINFSLSGDFGEIYATSTADDSAARRLDVAANYTADESSTSYTLGSTETAGETSGATTGGTIVSYFLPTMVDGLKAGVSYSNGGTTSKANATEWAVQYSGSASGASYKIAYQAGSKSANGALTTDANYKSGAYGSSNSGWGIEVSAANFTVGTESTSSDSDNPSSNDKTYTASSVKYAMGDITLAYAVESRDEDGGDTSDFGRSAMSISYAIAPGLTANVTSSSSEKGSGADKKEDDVTIFALNASF